MTIGIPLSEVSQMLVCKGTSPGSRKQQLFASYEGSGHNTKNVSVYLSGNLSCTANSKHVAGVATVTADEPTHVLNDTQHLQGG